MADKDIPGCYDPVYQAERLAMEQDKLRERTCQCHLYSRTMYPGDKYHEHRGVVVCSFCMEELNESEEFVE